MASTLIITNDFPPRVGGIESFVSEICTLLDNDVVVYASGSPGAKASDRDRPFPVIRDGPLLLPTPRVARRTAGLLRAVGATRVIFGAAAPLVCWPQRCAVPGPARFWVSPMATKPGGRDCPHLASCFAGLATVVTTSPPSPAIPSAALPARSAQAHAGDCCGWLRRLTLAGSGRPKESLRGAPAGALRLPG